MWHTQFLLLSSGGALLLTGTPRQRRDTLKVDGSPTGNQACNVQVRGTKKLDSAKYSMCVCNGVDGQEVGGERTATNTRPTPLGL